MPNIPSFIPLQFRTLRTGLEDEALAEMAVDNLALAESSERAIELAGEWAAICEARTVSNLVEFDARRDKSGLPVFIVASDLGYFESGISYQDAFERLVDSHRTRAEDLESTHRLMLEALGLEGNPYQLKRVRAECAALASRLGEPSAERDRLVLEAIAAIKHGSALQS